MRAWAPGRAASVDTIVERIRNGETHDKSTGRPLESFLAEEDKECALTVDADMEFWIRFDAALAGARGEHPFNPPSEVVAAMDRCGLETELHREVAVHLLEQISIGRAQGLGSKIEREKGA